MQRFPPLAAGSAIWRLPLADSTAAVLAESLLVDPSQREPMLAGALSLDPAATLWTICRAGQLGGADTTTPARAAAWLSQHALSALAWPHGLDDTQLDERNRNRWGEMVAAGVAAARAIRGDEQQVIELTRDVVDWLSTCGPTIRWPDIHSGRTCVPPWLAHRLQSSQLSGDRSGQEYQSVGEQARARWLADTPGPGRRLLEMVARLRRLNQLDTVFDEAVQREKLESLKRFAYGAGHEINNPLANISIRAQTLLQDESDPERRRKLATISSQAFRAHEMIADLMLFAQPPKLVPQSVNVVQLVDEVLGELATAADSQNTIIRHNSQEEEIVLSADPTQLNVALRSVCINSLEAVGLGGTIDISVQWAAEVELRRGRWVEIKIRDSGPGIAQDVRNRLFDPFYSGREAGRGLGFGLSKCWRVVTGHGGEIVVDSQPGRGATFTIMLPQEGAEAPA